jgi:hypothetical protein
MVNQKFGYGWLLGTKPDTQHRSSAKLLMHALFKLAQEDDLPCYLETESKSSAVKFHTYFGYKP